MKIISSHAFKFLTSNIHPPLPRTPQESRQLLSVLTSSFRRQLDREHPPVQPSEPQTPARSASGGRRSGSSVNADQHMSSILNHPLFSTVPHQQPARKRGIEARGQIDTNSATEDIVSTLDRAIASGTADTNVLHDCLCRHRLRLEGLAHGVMRREMRDSALGSRITSWLSSANKQSRADFFRNQLTIRFAMPYMVNERYRSEVVKWLEEIRQENPCTSQSTAQFEKLPQFTVLYEYVYAESKYGDGIVPALRLFTECCHLPTLENTDDTLPSYMLFVASRIAQWICRLPETKAKAIPIELYDAFTLLFEGEPFIESRKFFWKAMLALHHPIHPNPELALQHAEMLSRDNIPKRRNLSLFIRMYLEATQLCIQQEEYVRASWLMSITKDLLPAQESPHPKTSSAGTREHHLGPTLGDTSNGLLPT
ncbi:hypothetical protein LOZ36_001684 [Ophidiomyces ophidiicola]|nr:hypothetical protein LOZ36_001684 [Ophidiomyces ophidiicola]